MKSNSRSISLKFFMEIEIMEIYVERKDNNSRYVSSALLNNRIISFM